MIWMAAYDITLHLMLKREKENAGAADYPADVYMTSGSYHGYRSHISLGIHFTVKSWFWSHSLLNGSE